MVWLEFDTRCAREDARQQHEWCADVVTREPDRLVERQVVHKLKRRRIEQEDEAALGVVVDHGRAVDGTKARLSRTSGQRPCLLEGRCVPVGEIEPGAHEGDFVRRQVLEFLRVARGQVAHNIVEPSRRNGAQE